MKLFKSGNDRFEEGNDLIRRKEFEKARLAFMKAIYKGSSESETAGVMIALLDLKGSPGEVEYGNAIEVLRPIFDRDNDARIVFGLLTLDCRSLLGECMSMMMENRAMSMPGSDTDQLKARAQALFDAAGSFQRYFGQNALPILEFYKSVSISGMQKANRLFALGNEDLAESVVVEDPRRAAEYLHVALNYYKQLRDDEAEGMLKEKIKGYAKAVSCWLCGREAIGETIHFVSMETTVTDLLAKGKQPSPLPSYENNMSIYVCKACYLAISNRADKIASGYHDLAMQEMHELENRLNERIDDMGTKMGSLEEMIESISVETRNY